MSIKAIFAYVVSSLLIVGVGLVLWHQIGNMFPSVKNWTIV